MINLLRKEDCSKMMIANIIKKTNKNKFDVSSKLSVMANDFIEFELNRIGFNNEDKILRHIEIILSWLTEDNVDGINLHINELKRTLFMEVLKQSNLSLLKDSDLSDIKLFIDKGFGEEGICTFVIKNDVLRENIEDILCYIDTSIIYSLDVEEYK